MHIVDNEYNIIIENGDLIIINVNEEGSLQTITETITINPGDDLTLNITHDPSQTPFTGGKFAVVSDIHIDESSERDYFKALVNYCVDNNISYIACAGDLVEGDENDFTYLNPAINYATEKGVEFQSCYGNHDSQTIYDLRNGSLTADQVKSNFNALNTAEGITTNTISGIGTFIYLSLDYNYVVSKEAWSDGASCGSTKLSDSDVQSLLNVCGSGCGYTSADIPYNYQYYNTSDLLSLASTLESNQSETIFLFTHHPFRHKAAADSYSSGRIHVYKDYDREAGNFKSMNGWGSNTLTGIQFYFLNWLNNKYKNVIWFTGHNHQPWGGSNYCTSDCYIIKPSGSSNSNYSAGSSNGITSALNVNLPSLKSTQEAGVVEVNDTGIKISELKISGNSASITGEYSYTFDKNYPYSNPPAISYGDTPSPTPSPDLSDGQIKVVIKNDLNETLTFTGYLRLQIAGVETDFCFRNSIHYTTSGNGGYYYYATDSNKNKYIADGYFHGKNTEKLNSGDSLSIIYTDLMECHSSSQVSSNGKVSTKFGQYFTQSTGVESGAIKLAVAIDRSSDNPNRVDNYPSLYALRYTDANGNVLSSDQLIQSKGVYYLSIYQKRSLYDSNWSVIPYSGCTSSDILNTSYVSVYEGNSSSGNSSSEDPSPSDPSPSSNVPDNKKIYMNFVLNNTCNYDIKIMGKIKFFVEKIDNGKIYWGQLYFDQYPTHVYAADISIPAHQSITLYHDSFAYSGSINDVSGTEWVAVDEPLSFMNGGKIYPNNTDSDSRCQLYVYTYLTEWGPTGTGLDNNGVIKTQLVGSDTFNCGSTNNIQTYTINISIDGPTTFWSK